MPQKTLNLSENFVKMLVRLPENGMGYQVVQVILNNGNILHKHRVLNCSILMLHENENITLSDIRDIRPEK